LFCAPIVERDAVDMVLGVGVIGSLKLGCALKGSVIRVPASNDRLDWLKYSETLSSRQLSISSALKFSEKLILLWYFDLVDNIDKYA
jgi:hypothetical protein